MAEDGKPPEQGAPPASERNLSLLSFFQEKKPADKDPNNAATLSARTSRTAARTARKQRQQEHQGKKNGKDGKLRSRVQNMTRTNRDEAGRTQDGVIGKKEEAADDNDNVSRSYNFTVKDNHGGNIATKPSSGEW